MGGVTQAAASVSGLRLKYPGGDALLFDRLSFTVNPGEKVLLLGPSGCGKSTLLQVLGGIVPRTVEIPMKADETIVPQRPGYVFQDPDSQFCMPYVDEELAFVMENRQVPRERMPELISFYLSKVGLSFENPHTEIARLSQGMKQRLAVACVLALEPDVLLLDEPTALLDPEGTEQVWETIRSAAWDRTLIIVEHKIGGILDLVDRVAVFSPEGRLIADGPPETVFAERRKELMDFGIWYPGVWEDYDELRGRRMPERVISAGALELERFRGLRGREPTIAVDRLSAAYGEWIAVTGANGAGKSTLLLALMKLIRSEGDCRLGGLQVKRTEDAAVQAAFVFQNPEFQFVTQSVEEEIAYSLEDKEEGHGRLRIWGSRKRSEPGSGESPPGKTRRLEKTEKVEQTLTDYGLLPYRKRHPFQLSTGQKRRLSVASAMAGEQRILLLDEPTFGLDARNTFVMLERLEQLRKEGVLIVMITHDPDIVNRFADREWRVAAGQVTELIRDRESCVPQQGESLNDRETEKGAWLACN